MTRSAPARRSAWATSVKRSRLPAGGEIDPTTMQRRPSTRSGTSHVQLAVREPSDRHALDPAASAGDEPLAPGQHQRDRSRSRTPRPTRAADALGQRGAEDRRRGRPSAPATRVPAAGCSIASQRSCIRSATCGMVVYSMSSIGSRPGSNGPIRRM